MEGINSIYLPQFTMGNMHLSSSARRWADTGKP